MNPLPSRRALTGLFAVLIATVTCVRGSQAQPTGAGKPPEFNVRNYGAIGDGVAADAPAIQSAINAASTAGGGTVLVPPGTYLVALTDNSPVAGQASALLLKSNITLHLMRGATIKLAAGQTTKNESAIIRNQNAFAAANFDHDMAIRGDGVVDGNSANNPRTSRMAFTLVRQRGAGLKALPSRTVAAPLPARRAKRCMFHSIAAGITGLKASKCLAMMAATRHRASAVIFAPWDASKIALCMTCDTALGLHTGILQMLSPSIATHILMAATGS